MRQAAFVVAGALLLAGCTTASGSDSTRLKVVTTTEILADLVRNVGGDRVDVSSVVPPGGDPHSYEPTPKDATRVTEADVTFTNHLLLEQQSLIKTIDANARNKDLNISLAEASETYGAHVIPLVENIGLDVLWLGLRVRGEGAQRGATRTSEVRLSATKLDGPGSLVVYLTESPAGNRQLITTHDAFGYLADAYGMTVAGFGRGRGTGKSAMNSPPGCGPARRVCCSTTTVVR